MQKLKLDVDTLAVTSFDPTPEEKAAKGTVAGHLLEATRHTICPSCYTLCAPYC